MAEDLVAELTLRLMNEMSGGIDEIKAQFDSLDGTLQTLTGVLGELTEALGNLQPPAALTDGMAGVVEEADDAVTAMQNLGAAIEDDVTKVKALKDAYAGVGVPGGVASDQIVAGGGRGGAAHDGGANDGHGGGLDGAAGDALSGGLFAAIEFASGREAADQYAAFNQTLLQTAIREGYSGAAAAQQADNLSSMLDALALSSGQSSKDLADSYYWLVTTGMNHGLINQLMPILAQDSTAYNIPVTEDAQNLYTLNGVLGISPKDMPKALSILSRAASLGHFSISDFDTYLPDFAGKLDLLKDGGIEGEIEAAAALEASRKQAGSSSEDAIDLADLMSYVTSPFAARYFDRTQRSKDLLGAPILGLFKKYHIPDINIPEYLDQKEAHGEGAFEAMMDLAHLIKTELPADASGSDVLEIYGALFHSLQAARAALAITNNFDQFKAVEDQLRGVSPDKVQQDFQTAAGSPQYQMRIFDEEMAQLERTLGQAVIPTLHALGNDAYFAAVGLQQIGAWWQAFSDNIAGPAIGTAAAVVEHNIDTHQVSQGERSFFDAYRYRGHEPLRLEITAPNGLVVTPKNLPAGTSVRVNQGQVLGRP